jgi:hypothetical protein
MKIKGIGWLLIAVGLIAMTGGGTRGGSSGRPKRRSRKGRVDSAIATGDPEVMRAEARYLREIGADAEADELDAAADRTERAKAEWQGPPI